MAGNHEDESAPRNLTRRDAIKGVIAAGAVSSAGYMFRSTVVRAQVSAPGSVERLITLKVNSQQRRVDVMTGDAGDHPSLQARPHRNQAWLRPCRVRSLHRSH